MFYNKTAVTGRILTLLVGLLSLVVLAACGDFGPTPTPVANPPAAIPTATVAASPPTPTAVPPTATAIPTVTTAPTAIPPTATAVPPTATSKPSPTAVKTSPATATPVGKTLTPAEAQKIIAGEAKEVLVAIKNKDGQKLAGYVHPDLGLRFSPYGNVSKQNLVFSAEKVKKLFDDNTKYTWGLFDGSGKPMVLTFNAYYDQFIYSHDFVTAPEVYYNLFKQRGNTLDNSKEFYPGSIIVEYHFPGFDPQYGGMDWESLKLVFSQKGSNWYLVGLIHDEWTI